MKIQYIGFIPLFLVINNLLSARLSYSIWGIEEKFDMTIFVLIFAILTVCEIGVAYGLGMI